MKRFVVNKKIGGDPYVIGLPVNIGYIFFAVTLCLILFLLVGFSFLKVGILIIIDLLIYLALSFISTRSLAYVQKALFVKKLKVIRNKVYQRYDIDK